MRLWYFSKRELVRAIDLDMSIGFPFLLYEYTSAFVTRYIYFFACIDLTLYKCVCFFAHTKGCRRTKKKLSVYTSETNKYTDTITTLKNQTLKTNS